MSLDKIQINMVTFKFTNITMEAGRYIVKFCTEDNPQNSNKLSTTIDSTRILHKGCSNN